MQDHQRAALEENFSLFYNICRICSCPAEYKIFAPIPAYLHGNTNEFLSWQKPINILLEETTGLKVSENDDLPHRICALCISYLKHAAIFRNQAIDNALNLKAIATLHHENTRNSHNTNPTTEKIVETNKNDRSIPTPTLNYSEDRQINTNFLLNNGQYDQNKVQKHLLNNFQLKTKEKLTTRTTIQHKQNDEQQMHFLNLLFDKDTNKIERARTRHRAPLPSNYNAVAAAGAGAAVCDDANVDAPYAGDEEFQTTTGSSDENDDQTKKHIFSYKEKNFEEDDIMDLDVLREAISINIPESCKERKCRACFRRFMFADSYNDHIESCIEYKFLIFIEEMNNLLKLRRDKQISPHEFIRRMIFTMRKTCDWLNANCGNVVVPPNNVDVLSKDLLPTERQNIAAAEIILTDKDLSLPTKLATKRKHNKLSDCQLKLITNKSDECSSQLNSSSTNDEPNDNLDKYFNALVITPKPIKGTSTNILGTATPITFENNILYEIERSQSRNSIKTNVIVDKVTTTTPLLETKTNFPNSVEKFNSLTQQTPEANADRVTFLEKLHKAATINLDTSMNDDIIPIPETPKQQTTNTKIGRISVRKDLKPINFNEATSITFKHGIQNCASCAQCNNSFETLNALEEHNAKYHNQMRKSSPNILLEQIRKDIADVHDDDDDDDDEARNRIIALFDEDDSV